MFFALWAYSKSGLNGIHKFSLDWPLFALGLSKSLFKRDDLRFKLLFKQTSAIINIAATFPNAQNGFDICLTSKPNSAHRKLAGDTKCMGLSVSDHRPSNRRRRLHSRCVFHRRKVTPAPHPLHFSLLRLALTVLTQVRWPERIYSRALKSGRILRHQGFLLGVAV